MEQVPHDIFSLGIVFFLYCLWIFCIARPCFAIFNFVFCSPFLTFPYCFSYSEDCYSKTTVSLNFTDALGYMLEYNCRGEIIYTSNLWSLSGTGSGSSKMDKYVWKRTGSMRCKCHQYRLYAILFQAIEFWSMAGGWESEFRRKIFDVGKYSGYNSIGLFCIYMEMQDVC